MPLGAPEDTGGHLTTALVIIVSTGDSSRSRTSCNNNSNNNINSSSTSNPLMQLKSINLALGVMAVA